MAGPSLPLREILAFHVEAGVDVALEEKPVNRFAEISTSPLAGEVDRPKAGREGGKPQARVQAFTPLPGPPPQGGRENLGATAAPDSAVMEARVAAKRAQTLDELRETLARFEGCALSATATQLVFADGTPGARAMFVGEAPGAEEDREGLPFVGRSGKLLDRMITAIGMKRSDVYIANIVPWRPPGNRTPTPQESAICLPFIRRQIELANPDFLVVMGKPAMQTLLGINEGIRGVRGRWVDYDTGTRTIRALVMFHPAYLLRSPNEKRHSWRDFLALKKALAVS